MAPHGELKRKRVNVKPVVIHAELAGGDKQVEVPVVVAIAPAGARAGRDIRDERLFLHTAEGTVGIVVIEPACRAGVRHVEVRIAVIVKVSPGAAAGIGGFRSNSP